MEKAKALFMKTKRVISGKVLSRTLTAHLMRCYVLSVLFYGMRALTQFITIFWLKTVIIVCCTYWYVKTQKISLLLTPLFSISVSVSVSVSKWSNTDFISLDFWRSCKFSFSLITSFTLFKREESSSWNY